MTTYEFKKPINANKSHITSFRNVNMFIYVFVIIHLVSSCLSGIQEVLKLSVQLDSLVATTFRVDKYQQRLGVLQRGDLKRHRTGTIWWLDGFRTCSFTLNKDVSWLYAINTRNWMIKKEFSFPSGHPSISSWGVILLFSLLLTVTTNVYTGLPNSPFNKLIACCTTFSILFGDHNNARKRSTSSAT